MSCDMPAKGERANLLIAGGDKTLYELIAEAVESASSRYWKLDAALEFQDGTLTLLSIGEDRIILGLCVERGGKAFLGDTAIEVLRKEAEKTPLGGILEVLNLTRAGLELDLQAQPGAGLTKPISIEELIRSAQPQQKDERPASQQEPGSGSKRHTAVIVDEQETTLWEKVSKNEYLTMEEVTRILTDLILFSITLSVSRDYEALLRQAAEESSKADRTFFRVHIELRDGTLIDIFFYKGSGCSALILEPSKGIAEWYTGPLDGLEERIRKTGINAARLDLVQCEKCMKVFLRQCVEMQEREKQRGKEEEKESRGGLLARLFRRRKQG